MIQTRRIAEGGSMEYITAHQGLEAAANAPHAAEIAAIWFVIVFGLALLGAFKSLARTIRKRRDP